MESCNISLSPCPDCNEEELALNSTDAIAVTVCSVSVLEATWCMIQFNY